MPARKRAPGLSAEEFHQQVRIQGGRAIYRGQVFEGDDYTEELIEWAKDVGWENADDLATTRKAA